MNTKGNYFLILVSILLLVFSGGIFAAGQTDAGEDDLITLNVRRGEDPGVIDPVADWSYEPEQMMFVPLVGYDGVKGEVYPRGATSWSTSSDGKVWTFNIRKNWNWSDGKPVTANDYEYSFKTILDPATAAPFPWRLSVVKNANAIMSGEMAPDTLGVTAIDDYTLQIELNEAASWFLLNLTSVGHAVPQWTREEFGMDWFQPENIVVCGPYKVTEWVVDDYLTFEKNPSYYDTDKVQIEKINYIVIPDDSTAMAMYENGELDQTQVPPEDITRVKNDPVMSKEFSSISQMNLNYYMFNTTAPPFDNVLVRKAFAAAIDKETIVNVITKGGEVVMNTATPPGCFGYIDPATGIGIPFDAKKAVSYLTQAGYPGGKGLPTIKLLHPAREVHSNVAQAVQKMVKDNLGVTIELAVHEGGGYGTAVDSGNYNIWRWGWGMDYPDANNILFEVFRNTGDPNIKFRSDEFNSIVEEAAVEKDPKKRVELYKKAEKILVQDEVGIIPLYATASNNVTKPYVKAILAPVFTQEWWLWEVNK